MTIDEQSVRAMMPNRTFGVSGESSGYTGPAQPFGRQAARDASTVPPVFRNFLRLLFI
jgi:hypothetical protein